MGSPYYGKPMLFISPDHKEALPKPMVFIDKPPLIQWATSSYHFGGEGGVHG